MRRLSGIVGLLLLLCGTALYVATPAFRRNLDLHEVGTATEGPAEGPPGGEAIEVLEKKAEALEAMHKKAEAEAQQRNAEAVAALQKKEAEADEAEQKNAEALQSLQKKADDLSREKAELERKVEQLKPSSEKPEKPGKPVVAMSLLVPCKVQHFPRMLSLFESIEAQTYWPRETLLALSLSEKEEDEFDWANLTSRGIPGLRVFVRGGKHYAGSNRKFLRERASSDLHSFFDCDDYLHPQRTEVLWKVFERYPELGAAIHGYKHYKWSEWLLNMKGEFVNKVIAQDEIENFQLKWTFESLRNATAITRLYGGKEWDVKDPDSEPPNRSKDIREHWWWPKDMGLVPRPRVGGHNGWVTTRKWVSEAVDYPDTNRGQDSLFNWRLIKYGVNFTEIDLPLGAYLGRG